ncbi:glycosyl transferase family 2 [Prosthecochloris aestuarii DSM 271]|uniref:Glycosyl transferase family 2 n=1 Tax=Prosthecochloris aestuarii (strain DSM 271 / SK 413) TaxID=290512 RepID=B4S4G2_PROA2|nr:glycosyltransferase [Prosthecochloris aestuarii]ACF45410.1 glycosyl transferase family 2 [Prosthecochloris aestuarii DSM 271]
MHPLVTVLMPVYNGEKHLADAVRSILDQTYRNFEFLVMDDGSTDKSLDIVKSFEDERIIVKRSDRNSGIAKTLNKGIALARGKYIARMDCDDISLPDRLRRQADYLETHSDTGLIGSGIQKIKKSRKQKVFTWPSKDTEIKLDLLFQSAFFHPTIMARASLLRKIGYDEELLYAQDYALWTKLAPETAFANLPEALLLYRTHDEQVTKKKGKQQAAIARLVKENYLFTLFGEITPEQLSVHHDIAERNRNTNLTLAGQWLEALVDMNRKKAIFPEDLFLKMMARKWWNCCKNNNQSAAKLWQDYKKSYLGSIDTGMQRNALKYLLKASFRKQEK